MAGTTVRWGIQRRVTHPTLALGIAPKRPIDMRVISDKWPPGLGWSGRRREWKQGVSTSPPPAGLQVHPPSSSQTSTVVGALDQLAPQKPWVFRPVSPAAAHQDSPLGAPQDSPWGPLRTGQGQGTTAPPPPPPPAGGCVELSVVLTAPAHSGPCCGPTSRPPAALCQGRSWPPSWTALSSAHPRRAPLPQRRSAVGGRGKAESGLCGPSLLVCPFRPPDLGKRLTFGRTGTRPWF